MAACDLIQTLLKLTEFFCIRLRVMPCKRGPTGLGLVSCEKKKRRNKLWLVCLWVEKQHLVITVKRNQNPQLQNFFSVLFQSKGTLAHNHKPENPLEGNSQKAVKKTLEFDEKGVMCNRTGNSNPKSTRWRKVVCLFMSCCISNWTVKLPHV